MGSPVIVMHFKFFIRVLVILISCLIFYLQTTLTMFLNRSEYDRGPNTFSPEGRLFQVSIRIIF